MMRFPFDWLDVYERRRLFDYRRDVRKAAAHYLRYANGIPIGTPFTILCTVGEPKYNADFTEASIETCVVRCIPKACPVLS